MQSRTERTKLKLSNKSLRFIHDFGFFLFTGVIKITHPGDKMSRLAEDGDVEIGEEG